MAAVFVQVKQNFVLKFIKSEYLTAKRKGKLQKHFENGMSSDLEYYGIYAIIL